MDYRVIRRWYTVQVVVNVDSEDKAIAAAKDGILLHEDFNEEDQEVEPLETPLPESLSEDGSLAVY